MAGALSALNRQPVEAAMIPGLLLALLVLVLPAFSQAEALLIPRELAAVAGEAGCEPVRGFYDRWGITDPPFLYGYVPGEGVAPLAVHTIAPCSGASGSRAIPFLTS